MGQLDLEQQHRGYCRKCGYDLRGQTYNRCPECGNEFNAEDPDTFADSPPYVMRLRLVVSPFCNRYVCAGLILALTTALYLVARNHTLSHKLPLPLKAPLSQLDENRLLPYRFREAITYDEVLLGQLGTNEYVQWVMEEPKVQGQQVSLFLTYYKGDAIRHMPAIHSGISGRWKLVVLASDNVEITFRGKEFTVPLRFHEWVRTGHQETGRRRVVACFYRVNGRYSVERSVVRQIVQDTAERHVFFSRVEVATEVDSLATNEQAIELVKRFLRVVIPVLLEDHWPDWENRPISPPSWFPWLPVKSRPLPVTQPSSEER